MKGRLAGRFLVLVLVSVAFSHHVYRNELHWRARGKQAFLADQSVRFDRSFAHPSAGRFFAGVLLFVLAFLIYEAFAAGSGALFARLSSTDSRKSHG